MLILWLERKPVQVTRHWWRTNDEDKTLGRGWLGAGASLPAGALLVVEMPPFDGKRAANTFGWDVGSRGELWVSAAKRYWTAATATITRWVERNRYTEVTFELPSGATIGELACASCSGELALEHLESRGELHWLCSSCGAMFGAEALFASELRA